MHIIGKINKNIYKCVTEDITTEEVIITDNQINHIKNRHPNDYENFSSYFSDILSDPDFSDYLHDGISIHRKCCPRPLSDRTPFIEKGCGKQRASSGAGGAAALDE